jgi:hypothetical protein
MLIAFDDGAFTNPQVNPPALVAQLERHAAAHNHPPESGRILDRRYIVDEKPALVFRSGG